MNKWYQTIIVNHKEKDGKTTHLLDDENYKKLCQERAEQLKEIERLHSIIKEVREYITSQKLHKFQDTTGGLTYEERKLLEILDKENDNGER